VTRKAALIGVAILMLLPAAALGARKPARLTLPLPAPGHVTIADVSAKVTADRPAGLVHHIRLRAPHAKRLPPSVRVLTATRFRRSKHGGTYSALVIVVNRATPATAGARSRAAEQNFLDILFSGTPKSRCPSCGFDEPDAGFIDGMCSTCHSMHSLMEAITAANADQLVGDAGNLRVLHDRIKLDWTNKGNSDAVFGNPSNHDPPDPYLDSGHYEDGHAFGWGLKTKPQIIQAEHSVIDDIIKDDQVNLVPHLEAASGTDLNANGQIDQPTTGGGQQITTVVGPPVVL